MTYIENLYFENLEEKSILSAASDMDTDSDLDVSVKLETSVPHVPSPIVNSVTALLAVQKNDNRKSVLYKTQTLVQD